MNNFIVEFVEFRSFLKIQDIRLAGNSRNEEFWARFQVSCAQINVTLQHITKIGAIG